MSHKKGTDKAIKLCRDEFESTRTPGRERTAYGWVAGQDGRDRGFTKIVYTVSRSGDQKTTGKIPRPGPRPAGSGGRRTG
ncbi:hypothetical protein GCM10010129_36360 [Streptomyces fumigatiscleroticus]|nr:hypothetical protein GCM10010129_36360 [Streptomyces fumigatiscleroticus]